jgi:hypothetical protein
MSAEYFKLHRLMPELHFVFQDGNGQAIIIFDLNDDDLINANLRILARGKRAILRALLVHALSSLDSLDPSTRDTKP